MGQKTLLLGKNASLSTYFIVVLPWKQSPFISEMPRSNVTISSSSLSFVVVGLKWKGHSTEKRE